MPKAENQMEDLAVSNKTTTKKGIILNQPLL